MEPQTGFINDDNKEEIPLGFYIGLISRQQYIAISHILKKYDITVGEFPFIMKLYNDGPITQHELTTYFYLTEGTVSRTVKKLKDKNVVSIEVNKNNKRQHIVTLTEEGKDKAKKIQYTELKFEKKLCNFLTDKEEKELKKILSQLAVNTIKHNIKLNNSN